MKRLLIVFLSALMFVSLNGQNPGTQIQSETIQRSFFSKLEFGDKLNISKLRRVTNQPWYWEPQCKIEGNTKVFTLSRELSFGGVTWSYTHFSTVKNKFFSISFWLSSLFDNSDTFTYLKGMLTLKYGEPADIFGVLVWDDENTNVVLSKQYSESQGGEMRYYVNLAYTDRILAKSQVKTGLAEL